MKLSFNYILIGFLLCGAGMLYAEDIDMMNYKIRVGKTGILEKVLVNEKDIIEKSCFSMCVLSPVSGDSFGFEWFPAENPLVERKKKNTIVTCSGILKPVGRALENALFPDKPILKYDFTIKAKKSGKIRIRYQFELLSDIKWGSGGIRYILYIPFQLCQDKDFYFEGKPINPWDTGYLFTDKFSYKSFRHRSNLKNLDLDTTIGQLIFKNSAGNNLVWLDWKNKTPFTIQIFGDSKYISASSLGGEKGLKSIFDFTIKLPIKK